MNDRATRTRNFAARVVLAATAILLLASLGLASERSNQKKNNVVSNVGPSACGLSSGTSNPAGGISGHTGTLYYGGSWVGNYAGTPYDAAMLSKFVYSSGNSGTFTGTVTYGLSGSAGGTSTLTGTWTIGQNCVGSISISSTNPITGTTLAFLYSPTVDQLQIIEADGNGSMSHTEYQLSTSHQTCDADDLDGTFSGVWTGVFDGDNYDANIVATITNNPDDVTGTVTYSIPGNTPLGTIPATATYTIGSNCTGTITLSSGAILTYVDLWHDQISIAETDGSGLMGTTITDLSF